MASRLELQSMLEKCIGSRNVYFQPPESLKMSYPAIRYSISGIENNHSNDDIYIQRTRYTLTVIDKDPDSVIVKVISLLPRCKFDRTYTSGGLNHTVFTLYY